MTGIKKRRHASPTCNLLYVCVSPDPRRSGSLIFSHFFFCSAYISKIYDRRPSFLRGPSVVTQGHLICPPFAADLFLSRSEIDTSASPISRNALLPTPSRFPWQLNMYRFCPDSNSGVLWFLLDDGVPVEPRGTRPVRPILCSSYLI